MLQALSTTSLNEAGGLLVAYLDQSRDLRNPEPLEGSSTLLVSFEFQPIVFRLAIRPNAEVLPED